MKKLLTLGLGGLMLAAALGLTASAQTTSSAPTIEELQKQIQLLLGQVGSLQKEVTSLKSSTAAPTTSTNSRQATPLTAPATPTTPPLTTPTTPAVIDESEVSGTEAEFIPPPTLTRSLFRGSRGEDVRQLQEFLAQDPTVYPDGLTSGYYGAGTEAAVRKWQAKNGLPSVGVIGRQTIAKFKEIYSGVLAGLKQQSDHPDTSILTRPTTPKPVPPTACPVYTYMPVCQENQSPYDGNSCRVCQQKIDTTKKELCPALPTVDSCLAGEERVVTYKSPQCGVYYACKPRASTRADNTTAVLKKISSIPTDNRYTVILNDPEGVQKFAIYNTKGAEIYSGYPACRTEYSSPVIGAESSEFPLKLALTDCGNPSSQFSTALTTPVIVQPVSEGIAFPYTFSNGKKVYSADEARSYCYANGPASGLGIAAECGTKFGITYQTTTTTSICDSNLTALLGTGCHYVSNDSANNPIFCDSAMTKSAKKGDTTTTAGCSGSTTTTTNSNWVQRTWNFKDGQTVTSSILNRTDAEYANYLAPIQAQCLTINKSQFGWKPNAGDSSAANWQNFGIPDCSGTASTNTTTTTATPIAGQKEQIWNSLGLKSWIRTDADSARIEQLKSACVNVSNGANIWLPGAGLSTSVDFGMPSADKCRIAATCSSAQYFDGAVCVANTYQTTSTSSSCPADVTNLLGSGCHEMYGSYYFNGVMDRYVVKGATAVKECSTSYVSGCSAGGTSTTSTNCSQYGSGWHTMSDGNCYDTDMHNYRTANGTLYSCSATPATGCSGTTTTTTSSCSSALTTLLGSGCHYMYPGGTDARPVYCDGPMTKSAREGDSSAASGCTSPTSSTCTSGQYWNGTACVNTSTTNCTSGQYWNGTACVANSTTTSTTCPTGQYWSGSSCVNNPTSSSSTTCSSGQYWNGTACVNTSTTNCTSGQYWNGTACVSSTTTTCPSGQSWNGTACVNNTTPSASVYDQMRDQLKSMEIILRGLLGR